MTKKATRTAYGEALVELGKINENVVVLDADLTKSTKTAMFQKEFPNRHINVGIAEGDLMSTNREHQLLQDGQRILRYVLCPLCQAFEGRIRKPACIQHVFEMCAFLSFCS